MCSTIKSPVFNLVVIVIVIVANSLAYVQGNVISGKSVLNSIKSSGVTLTDEDGRIKKNQTKKDSIIDCSSNPKISILSYNRDEFLATDKIQTEMISIGKDLTTEEGSLGQVWMAPFAATIEIECEAGVPIEWTFDGPHEPEVISIDVRREAEADSPAPCFRIVTKLITRKISTGKYRCKPISSENKGIFSAWLFLYAEVNGPPFLLYQGREFTVAQDENSRTVTLPCQVVNPTVSPELFKGNSQVLALQGSIPYNPQTGFTLDLQKIPNPFDNYKCSREGGSVYISVKQRPDFRVNPSATHLTIVNGSSIKLVCEGVFPIGLQGFLDDSKVMIIEDANAQVYTYKVTYDYDLSETEPSTGVSCVNLKTREILHTWHSKVISKEDENQSGIQYDPSTQRFYCFSKTEDPPIIALAKCNGVMECQLTDKCFRWDAPYKITNGGNTCFSENQVQRGITCRNEDKLRFKSNLGCAYVPNTAYSAGTVHCALPDNGQTVQAYFFNGLVSGADLAITDWRSATPGELVDIDILERNRTFYTHELIEFECTVPKFIFAKGQIFKFKLNDGSYVSPVNETVREDKFSNDADDGVITRTSRLEIHDARITEIICISPFWNSTGYLNNSVSISVTASTVPRFINKLDDTEPRRIYAGTNASFTCEAEGLPLPKIAWFRNGKRAEDQKEAHHKKNNGKSTSTILAFDYVNPDDEGDYVCETFNVAGRKTRKLSLIVTQNRRTAYTAMIIGLITLATLLAILIILWRKLRKNQALVRRLTEKEVKEFREGDTAALNAIPDGYIRAQFLPYDKEYEIKQENLEIDEEVLGKGEYGIVLKGILRHNDSTKEVAVKTSRSPDVNHFKALLTELKMLTYIGWHDNVINLLGAVTRNLRDGDVYVVVEYCRLGDLESFLRQNRASYLNQIVNDKIDLNLAFNFDSKQAYQPVQYTMSTADLISWSYQISSGMEYLANKKVIHGDLAARNILLTDDRTVKITDFGLSKHLYNGSNYISHATLNLPWKHCSPEILQFNSFSTQSDIWAVGVTLWEIFTLGEVPYPGVSWSWDFKNQLLQGYRLEKPNFANSDIYNIILKCWKNTPAERVSFEELRKYFHRLLHHWAEENFSNSSEETSPMPTQGMPQVTVLPPVHVQHQNHYVASPTAAVHYTTVAA